MNQIASHGSFSSILALQKWVTSPGYCLNPRGPYHKLVPLPQIPDSCEQYCKSCGSSYTRADKPLHSSALTKARLQQRTDLLHKMTRTLSQ